MKNYLLGICLAMAWTGVVAEEEGKTSFSVGIVNRIDDVRFNIASDLSGTETPNILSELHWDEIDTWLLTVSADRRFGRRTYLFVHIGAGIVDGGQVQDSDYLFDDRTGEFIRSYATVDGDDMLTGEFGVGYQFDGEFALALWSIDEGRKAVAIASRYRIRPFISYVFQEQNLQFVDGVLAIPFEEAFDGLNSSYDHEWKSIVVGVESEFMLAGRLSVSAGADYFVRSDFKSTADWNLRSSFQHPVSFIQSAEADGKRLSAGINYRFSDRIKVNLSYSHQRLNTESGTDEVFFSDGTVGYTRLNEASWNSRGITLQMQWTF